MPKLRAEIYDYRTGDFLRKATPDEYAEYLDEIEGDRSGVGAVSGRPYGIRGTIYMEAPPGMVGKWASVSKKQLQDLMKEAQAAGDQAQVKLCKKALNGDKDAMADCEEAIEEAKASRNASLLDRLVRLAHEKPELRDDLLPLIQKSAASPRGKAQKAILEKVLILPPGYRGHFTDVVRGSKFRLMHFKALMKAAEVLHKKGLVYYDGKVIGPVE